MAVAGFHATAGVAASSAKPLPCDHGTNYLGSQFYPQFKGNALGLFVSLSVSGVSCHRGIQVAIAYQRCRVQAGGASGRCLKPVLGFTCQEKRQSSPLMIAGRVTCRRRGAVVLHSYIQDL